jgi:Arc/MetJ-type ribon-helix-helix transcriptional regulator
MAVKQKRKDEYTTIRLPKELMDEAKKLVGVRGFKSSSEVAEKALREYLDEYFLIERQCAELQIVLNEQKSPK